MIVLENDAKPPKISIGMPVYNGEKYIIEAIESILNQTFDDFELVISDNCSDDGTESICRNYALNDARVNYIRQPENIGASNNFKYLLHHARAEYFMWLAHDDMIGDTSYLDEMYKKAINGHDFCFANTKILSESGEIDNKITNRFEGCKTTYDFCKQTTYICSYQIYGLFRKSFLVNNYYYLDQCSHMNCYGEGLIVHAMTLKSLPCYLPNISLIYRRHSSNQSSMSNGRHYNDFFQFTFYILRLYIKSADLTILQKLLILKNIVIVHLRHLIVLTFPKISSINVHFP